MWRAVDAHSGGLRLKMEPWKVHHFDEDQNPDPHESEKSDPETH